MDDAAGIVYPGVPFLYLAHFWPRRQRQLQGLRRRRRRL
jgi:hypothetical protein